MSAENNDSNNTDSSKPNTLIRILKWLAVLVLAILLFALILGLVPVSTDGFESDPDPAQDHEEALRRFNEIQAQEQAIVNDAGSSLLMTHGSPTEQAYVLIHGTTNSPRQFEELGQILFERGHNVLILRMPHHGLQSHSISELKGLKARELRAYADTAIDIASGLGEEITVVGLSGGGAVTSWIAQNRADVRRVLPLSPFFGIAPTPVFVDTLLMNIFARLPNVDLEDPLEPQREWVYRGESARGVAEFMHLGKAVFKQASEAGPAVGEVFFVTTAVDDTADNDYVDKLAGIWGKSGADVSTFEFDASFGIPHNSIDPAADPVKKEMVYAKILELLGEEPLE